jgi:tellurite resistance protein
MAMFNPEKILGGLLRSGSRGGIFGITGKGAIGLGLLGVAVAAVEHFMDKSEATQRGGTSPVTPPAFPKGPPPAPGSTVPPPPPSRTASAIWPPLPGPAPYTVDDSGSESVLLIRAMIAAAHADGNMDQDERLQILERLKTVELTPEEQGFIARELLSPCGLEEILKAVKTREIAKQVYAVSLMAVELDTETERDYIRQLARRLGLDPVTLQEIQRDLGIQEIKKAEISMTVKKGG